MTQKLFFFALVILSTFSYFDLAQFEIFARFFHGLHENSTFFLRLSQTRVNINQNLLQIIILDFEIFIAFCVDPI